MDMTSDKLRSLVRKWQSLIECNVDVITTDGFKLRVFAIAFTKRRPNQVKKTSYAQSNQVKNIRKKMVEIIQRETSDELMKVCEKFQTEVIGKEIEKACLGIYPLQNVFVRKVKALRQPKLEGLFIFFSFFVVIGPSLSMLLWPHSCQVVGTSRWSKRGCCDGTGGCSS